MWKFWRDFPGFEKERRKIKPHKSKHKIFEEKQEIHETEKQCVENPKRWKLWTAIAWLEKRGKRSYQWRQMLCLYLKCSTRGRQQVNLGPTKAADDIMINQSSFYI